MENQTNERAFSILDPNSSYTQYGLTKREYFAAHAMQGLLAKGSIDRLFVADMACDMADCLIERLNETSGHAQL